MHNETGRPAAAARTLRLALQALDDAEVEEALAARDGDRQAHRVVDGHRDGHHDGPGPASQRLRLTVRVLLALSLAEFEQEGLEPAQTTLGIAVQQAQAIGDTEMEALGRSQHAMLLGRSGQLAAALDELDRAAEHLDVLAPRDQCIVLLNRGMARSELREPHRATADFAATRDLAHEHGLHRLEFMATHNLGYAAYLAGDMPAALSAMVTAQGIETDASQPEARLDRGRVLLEAGLVSDATEVLAEAVRLCSDRQHQIRSEAELELARALAQLGDLPAAERVAESARRRFTRRATPLWADRAQLEQLQIALAGGQGSGTVESRAVAMASRASAAGDGILTSHASLLAAEAAWETGRAQAAAEHAETAGSLRETGSLSTRLRLELVLARCAHDRGDRSRAATILRAAARDLHLAQGGTASLDLRTARGIHGVMLAELDTSLALDNGAGAVLAASERWRNASAALPVITPPEDPVLAGLLTELRGILTRLRDESLGPDEAAELREHHGLLQRRIRLRDWATRSQSDETVDPHVSTSAVRAVRGQLEEADTDLVSFVPHRGELLSVTVVRGRATLRRLGPLAEAMELVARLHVDLQALAVHGRGPMGSVLEGSLVAQLQRVQDVMLRGLPAGRPLLVIPTLALTQLPWGMLPRRRGVPTSVAASATAWARRPRTATGEITVAVVGGPGLPLAEEEVAKVAATWDVDPVTPEASTAGGLREALRDNEIVHVAAHGRHEKESPLFSSLRLADGPVFAHEMANTGVGARHVVLSACDVGLSTVRPGDEPLGLAAALLHLGASAVVAPVCRIPDDVAERTMVTYHQHLRAGVDAAEALARASDGPDLLAAAFAVAGSPYRVTGHTARAPHSSAPHSSAPHSRGSR